MNHTYALMKIDLKSADAAVDVDLKSMLKTPPKSVGRRGKSQKRGKKSDRKKLEVRAIKCRDGFGGS